MKLMLPKDFFRKYERKRAFDSHGFSSFPILPKHQVVSHRFSRRAAKMILTRSFSSQFSPEDEGATAWVRKAKNSYQIKTVANSWHKSEGLG